MPVEIDQKKLGTKFDITIFYEGKVEVGLYS